jgi:sigma-B regulation protein RsbU (phosphoserine phosphatase)
MMARRLQRNNDALIEKVEQQVKYQLMQKDLETAAKIQSNIVPNGDLLFPNHSEVDAFALINQARDVGGDFYDAMVLDQDLLYFAIGDVSGKGIPAALFMMRTLTSLRMLLSSSSSFDAVIPAVNNWLAKDNEDMMFVSLFAGILNVRTGMLRYVNAGHNPPYASLDGKKHQLLDLPEGTLLGLFENSPFPVTHLQLKHGDSLVLYTDGITDAKGAPEDMFDFSRTAKTLNRKKQNSMKEMVHYLEAALEDFVGAAPQVDDYTIFALRYLGDEV